MFCGYLSSSFDLLNVEDLDLIAQARGVCEVLIVGVYSDELVERLYGRAPVVGLDERVALLRHVRGIADVWVHDDLEPARFRADHPQPVSVIAVDGRPGGALPADPAVWLTSGRRTQSSALRRALRPSGVVHDVAVA